MYPIKIAVADDNHELRQLTLSLLSNSANLNVVLEAVNGRDLLLKLSKNMVDIIILDIIMPVLDGVDTLKILKHKYPKLNVIMFSSTTDPIMIDLVKEIGANSFVCKKSPELLIKTIDEVHRNNVSYNSLFLP